MILIITDSSVVIDVTESKDGIDLLCTELVTRGGHLLPGDGAVTINVQQFECCLDVFNVFEAGTELAHNLEIFD